MSFLSGFNITLTHADLLGRASLASFAGNPIPAGWTVVTPDELGLDAQYQDGIYFTIDRASAIVLRQGNDYIVAFRGTDEDGDVQDYPKLFFGTYIDQFDPLLAALKAATASEPDAHFSFTGASLGGGAVNQMAVIAGSRYEGHFANSTFVAFASPNISDANWILNLGVENDPVYKSIPASLFSPSYEDYDSSADNLVLANDEYVSSPDGSPDLEAHSAKEALTLFSRFSQSAYYSLMDIDSVIVISASDGLITDKDADRADVGAFYLGRQTADNMLGRAGIDYLEGFGGDDVLNGGRGADRLRGGDGHDTFVVRGAEAKFDRIAGGNGTDTLKVIGTSSAAFDNFNARASSLQTFEGNGRDVLGDGTDNVLDFSGLTSITGMRSISGGAGNDTLVGSAFSDVILGGSGKDLIQGGPGNDTLSGNTNSDVVNGGLGNDKLTGGGGNDAFVFNTALSGSTNVDSIGDFNVIDDVIRIDHAVFTGLSTGALASTAFRANTTGNAADATDRIIYETDTGNLYFDADGDGAGARVLFAKLDTGLSLTNADFVVI